MAATPTPKLSKPERRMALQGAGGLAQGLADRVPFKLPFWVISDTHFFHRNIIDYCGRPENHDRLMIEAWQRLVSPEQVIVHLGDLAFGSRERIAELAPKLPGRKYLILGNHDRRGKCFYRDLGFTPIRPFALRWGQTDCVFTHHPDYEHKFLDRGDVINVHGHIHKKLLEDRRFLNVSVEHTGYAPVQISELLDQRIAELDTAP